MTIAERDAPSGRETARLVQSAGGEALFVETDVTENDSMQAAVRTTVDAFVRLDILYNNVGGSTLSDGPVTEAPEAEFWRKMSTCSAPGSAAARDPAHDRRRGRLDRERCLDGGAHGHPRQGRLHGRQGRRRGADAIESRVKTGHILPVDSGITIS